MDEKLLTRLLRVCDNVLRTIFFKLKIDYNEGYFIYN